MDPLAQRLVGERVLASAERDGRVPGEGGDVDQRRRRQPSDGIRERVGGTIRPSASVLPISTVVPSNWI
jgi:hypothetical protein